MAAMHSEWWRVTQGEDGVKVSHDLGFLRQTFSVKSEILNILGSVGHTVSC